LSFKPWQRPHIKTQAYWVVMVLSEKGIMKKYGYSGKEISQGMVDLMDIYCHQIND
jgi:hypothetical protein